MSRGKFSALALLLCLTFSTEFALAQKSRAPRKTKAAPKSKVVRKAPKFYRFSMGLGYMTWGETLRAKDNSGNGQSVANYAGLTFFVDQTVTQRRWVYGASAGVAMGKATASEWGSFSYPDAGQRPWSAGYVEGYGFYRIRANVMVGAGALGLYRMADWTSSQNPELSVEKLNNLTFSPGALLRWHITRRLILAQNLNFVGSQGDTIWRWSTLYTF